MTLKRKWRLLLFYPVALAITGCMVVLSNTASSAAFSPKLVSNTAILKKASKSPLQKRKKIIPAAEPEQTAAFLAAGDNIIHNVIYWDALAVTGGKSYDFHPMYADVKSEVKKFDFAFVNQESILGGTSNGLSSYPQFNSPQEVGNALVDTGFNIISTANNHSMDRGFAAVTSSCDYWKNKPSVITAGTYKNKEDYDQIPVLSKNGIKLAFIAGAWDLNGNNKPSGKNWCVETDFTDILKKTVLARKMADVVVVSMHWGIEYENSPCSLQKTQAQQLADAGADIIIGNHPHVIQNIEWIQSNKKRSIVAYALGNFLSGQDDFRTMVGGFLELKIVKKGGTVTLENPSFVPVVTCYENSGRNFRVRLLSNYTNSIAANHSLAQKGVDMSPNHIKKYVKSIISPEFSAEK